MANKTTSKAVATKASKILSDNRYGKNTRKCFITDTFKEIKVIKR